MKKLSLLTLGLLLSILCNSQNLKPIDWSADIDFLANELPQKHYNFFTIKDKKEFLAGLDKIKQCSKESKDFDVALRLQQLIAGFGDSHTSISYGQFIDRSKLLPLGLNWFKDGLYIIYSTQEYAEIVGSQILSLNGVPVKTITDSLSTLVTNENSSIVKNTIPRIFSSIQILEYFKFCKVGDIKLEVKDLKGNVKTFLIKPAEVNKQNAKTFNPDSVALCNKNMRAFFIDYYLAADNVYYIQYNNCSGKEVELMRGNAQYAEKLPSFKEFEEKVFQTLNTNPVNKFVFDIRFNGGGNSAQGTEFAEKLAKYLEGNPKMKVYVILGRNTFSSAILNAMDFKKLMNAVFVGEETAGKPNHFGEVKGFQLPNSGLQVNYSTKYFQRTNEKVNTIKPDVYKEASFTDYSKGIDPAYEWIKKQ